MEKTILLTLTACFLLIIFVNCSEKSTKSTLEIFVVKVINEKDWVNPEDYTNVQIIKLWHIRDKQVISKTIDQYLSPGEYFILPNLIDGGKKFRDGDSISVSWECIRSNGEYGGDRAYTSIHRNVNILITHFAEWCDCKIEK